MKWNESINAKATKNYVNLGSMITCSLVCHNNSHKFFVLRLILLTLMITDASYCAARWQMEDAMIVEKVRDQVSMRTGVLRRKIIHWCH